MKLRSQLDAGIIVADALWLAATAVLVLVGQPSEVSLHQPSLPSDDTFRFLWRAVSVGLVVVTGVWVVETVVRVAGTQL